MQPHTDHDFDVFLSYHGRDRALVEDLAGALREFGIKVFFDRWYLCPGRAWPQELEAAVSACQSVAVCIGPGAMGPWQQREVNMALGHQVRDSEFPIIPVLLPGADPVLGFLSQYTWIDLRDTPNDPVLLSILADAIARKAPSPSGQEHIERTVAAICPYRGLLYFREEDAPFFFGRAADIEQLMNTVDRGAFVAVVGASGCGKSSVVRAGLLPKLRRSRGQVWEIATVIPGDRPMNSLAAVILPLLEPHSTEADRLIEADKLAGALETGNVKLRDIIERALTKQSGTDRLLIFVDQWEELYTLTGGEAVRKRFIDELLDVSARAPVSVVLSLRGDFVGHALAYRPLSDRLQGAQVNLGPMTRAELARAIQSPADKVGLVFEAGLVDRILDDAGLEPGNLPLLEFVLKQLWDSRRRGDLLHSVYGDMGCLQGSVATKANEIYSKLSPAEKETVQRIFLQLATPGEQGNYTRRRASFAEIGAPSLQVLARLTDARLLVTSPGSGNEEGAIELAHEALIQNWDKLRSWLDQDREFLLWRKRLAGFVDVWRQIGQVETGLLAGAFLTEAEKWLSDRRDRLSAEERQYVAASISFHQREQDKAKRRRQAFVSAVSAIGVVAVLFAFYSQYERRQATKEAAHSLALQLAAQSGQIAATRPVDALLLGVAAVYQQATYEANDNLIRLLSSMPQGLKGFLWGHTGTVFDVAFSPDGATLATGSKDGTVILWSLERRQALGEPLHAHTGAVLSVAFSPDGKTLATGGTDKSVRLWDVASRQLLGDPLKGHTGTVRRIVFRPDGERFVTIDDEQTARLWNVASHKLLADSRNENLEDVWNVFFTSDGDVVAVGIHGLEVVLWDLNKRKPIGRPLGAYSGPPWIVAFSGDGKRLATAQPFEDTVSLWDASSGKQLGEPLEGHTGAVSSVGFSPDGKTLAAGSTDRTVTLWDVTSNKRLAWGLKAHTGAIDTLAFSPDGATLATGSSDRTVALWNVADLRSSRERTMRCLGPVNSITFSPDGKMLAAAEDQKVGFWDVASRQKIGEPIEAGNTLVSIAFGSEGKTLAGASMDGVVTRWDVASRKPLDEPFKVDAHSVRRVAFSLDGEKLAAASFDGLLTMWDIASHKASGEPLKKQAGPVRSVSFSPDGKMLATGGQDNAVILWDVARGAPLGEPLKGQAAVWSVAFSPDGKTLASGSSDGTLIMWDVSSRRQLGDALTGHNGAVLSIAFHPKGNVLATAGSDRTAVLWDLVNRKPLGEPLRGHSADVTSVAFSPDGGELATGSWDHSVVLWDVVTDAESAMARACQIAGRDLTESEWRQYMGQRPYRKVCRSVYEPDRRSGQDQSRGQK